MPWPESSGAHSLTAEPAAVAASCTYKLRGQNFKEDIRLDPGAFVILPSAAELPQPPSAAAFDGAEEERNRPRDDDFVLQVENGAVIISVQYNL